MKQVNNFFHFRSPPDAKRNSNTTSKHNQGKLMGLHSMTITQQTVALPLNHQSPTKLLSPPLSKLQAYDLMKPMPTSYPASYSIMR